MKRVLCTICARGGSKGVPGKNLREIAGKPLIAHTIKHAHDWGNCDDIVVSTDDDDIAEVAREHEAQVPFIRPSHLATDDAAKLPVVKHALGYMEEDKAQNYDYVLDLDPTSPLRNVSDIQNCFETATEDGVDNTFTVCEADKNPYFNMVELDENGFARLSKRDKDVVRRQDAPQVYEMNASIYVFERDHLVETDSVVSDRSKVSVMPPERSVDIDRPIDLEFVRFLMERDR